MCITPKIPDHIPVSILSVVGAFRSGKSFILDFFLRFLRYAKGVFRFDFSYHVDTKHLIPTAVGKIPEWMHYGGDILEGSSKGTDQKGFSYRGGSERNTQGIWMWSEPFVLQSDAVKEGKMCVLLVDTQGLFDGFTGQHLTTSIFGLSTLLSSYQIYNIDKRLQEDNLQHLALFSEYSRVVFNGDDSKRLSMTLSSRSLLPSSSDSLLEAAARKEEAIAEQQKQMAPFQQLDFLVRDWQNFADESNFKQCLQEMDKYKEDFLKKRSAEDLRVCIVMTLSLRKRVIKSSFAIRESAFSCFRTLERRSPDRHLMAPWRKWIRNFFVLSVSTWSTFS